MFSTLRKSFQIPDLRKKILIVLFIIFLYKVVANIPLPGVDRQNLQELFASSQLLGLIDLFQGGALSRLSLATIGLGPYITASIAMQMSVYIFPALKEMQKEGAYGIEKINRYTKLLTLPIALAQSFGLYTFFSSQGIFLDSSILTVATIILSMVAGSFVLLWFGDLITEQGIGQGVSIIILVSILSGLPYSFQSGLVAGQSGNFFNLGLFAAVAIAVVAGVVYVNDAIRKIEIAYASSNTQNYKADSYLPLKVNQAGVIPIIFAISLVLLPSLGGNILLQAGEPFAQIGLYLTENFTPTSLLYNVFYFILVVFFTFFYTAFTFNPDEIAEDLKKRGGFIPGIRPGKATADYLNKILTRITFVGALFLGFIAIMPVIASAITGINVITIGGTGILIAVSVILETLKQIESQVIMYEYEDVSI